MQLLAWCLKIDLFLRILLSLLIVHIVLSKCLVFIHFHHIVHRVFEKIGLQQIVKLFRRFLFYSWGEKTKREVILQKINEVAYVRKFWKNLSLVKILVVNFISFIISYFILFIYYFFIYFIMNLKNTVNLFSIYSWPQHKTIGQTQ